MALFPFKDGCCQEQDAIDGTLRATLVNITTAPGENGSAGGSIELQGNPLSYVEIPAVERLDLRHSMTILVSVYPLTSKRGPIVNYKSDGHGVQMWIMGETDGKGLLLARFLRRDLTFTTSLQRGVLETGKWNYIGASYDFNSGLARLWHEGLVVQTENIGKIELATQFDVRLGAISTSFQNAFHGRVSCLQFYSTALSSEHVLAAEEACDKSRW